VGTAEHPSTLDTCGNHEQRPPPQHLPRALFSAAPSSRSTPCKSSRAGPEGFFRCPPSLTSRLPHPRGVPSPPVPVLPLWLAICRRRGPTMAFKGSPQRPHFPRRFKALTYSFPHNSSIADPDPAKLVHFQGDPPRARRACHSPRFFRTRKKKKRKYQQKLECFGGAETRLDVPLSQGLYCEALSLTLLGLFHHSEVRFKKTSSFRGSLFPCQFQIAYQLPSPPG